MAMLQESRSKGILRGGISGLVLEDITREVNYEQGDYIVTSGLDGQLKEGILIGKAGGLQSSSSELFKNISVEPIADLSKLELVFILK
jgi:cell shape-determining protein MreC